MHRAWPREFRDDDGAAIPERVMLLVAVTLVLSYTVAPFDFSVSRTALVDRAAGALDVAAPAGALKLAAHAAAFFILGVVIAAANERSIGAARWLPCVAVAVVLCTGLEFVQLLQESRHARVTDILVNSCGICLGVAAAIRWPKVRARRLAWQAWMRRRSALPYGAVIAIMTIAWCAAGLQPLLGALQLNWDETYPLLIGDERDWSRPWRGELGYVGIYGQALTGEQVAELHRGLVAGTRRDVTRLGLLAGYDFRRELPCSVVPEGMTRSDALVLRMPQTCGRVAIGPLILSGGDRVVSNGPASAVTRAVASSGAFSVEASVRAAKGTQAGHARIVTVSDGISTRNFTLGHTGTAVVFRVRNATTGLNATEYPLVVSIAAMMQWQHLVAVYDHGVSVLYANGLRQAPIVDLRLPTAHLGLGTEAGAQIAAAALLTSALALPVFGVLRLWMTPLPAHAAAVIVTLLVGSAPYVISSVRIDLPWPLAHVGRFGLVLVAVYLVAAYYATHTPSRCEGQCGSFASSGPDDRLLR